MIGWALSSSEELPARILYDNVTIMQAGISRGVVTGGISPWVIRDIFFGGLDYGSRTMLMHDRTDNMNEIVDGLLAVILVKPVAANSGLDDVADRFDKIAARIEKSLGDD